MSKYVAYYDSAIKVESTKARDDIVGAVHSFTESVEAVRVRLQAAREAEARGFDIRCP